MSVSSPCEICHRADVSHTCNRCGKLVCHEHFEEDVGLCVECSAEVAGGREGIPADEDAPDGVDTYRF